MAKQFPKGVAKIDQLRPSLALQKEVFHRSAFFIAVSLSHNH